MASVPSLRAHRTPGRHTHWRLAGRRHLLLRGGTAAALLAVVGPGLLAGLSDDDPAGIATYSILGAKYGYELLWVLALSTAALIVFHELGVRLGIVTGKGLLTLVREHHGQRAAWLVLTALAVAATPITPAANPSRKGVARSARDPNRKTGTAPSPVASAVAEAARRRTMASGMQRGGSSQP